MHSTAQIGNSSAGDGGLGARRAGGHASLRRSVMPDCRSSGCDLVAAQPGGRVRRRHPGPQGAAGPGGMRRAELAAAHLRHRAEGSPATAPRPPDLRHDRRHPGDAAAAVRLRDQHRRAAPVGRRGRPVFDRRIAPAGAGPGQHAGHRHPVPGGGHGRTRAPDAPGQDQRRHLHPRRFRAAPAAAGASRGAAADRRFGQHRARARRRCWRAPRAPPLTTTSRR